MAISGRTSTTKAMGKGSTQFQHTIQTEVPPKLLEEWLAIWSALRAARGVARRASAPSRRRELRARHPRPGPGEARQRDLREHPRPARAEHPVGARPEQLRRRPAQEAADDARAAVPVPPLQGGLGALRDTHRRQPAPGAGDEGAGHLRLGRAGGRRDHRRGREQGPAPEPLAADRTALMR
jgi:hypothetical protein